MRGHVISSIYFRFLFICRHIEDKFFYHNIIKVAVETTGNKISLVKLVNELARTLTVIVKGTFA